MTFAQQLRHMRGDLTQVAAARAISPDLPLATYQDWEQADAEGRGRREPPRWIQRTAIGKLALATGKPPIVTWDGCETMKDVRTYLGMETRPSPVVSREAGATVTMNLTDASGEDYALAQMGPDFLIARDGDVRPALGNATVHLSVDGNLEHIPVRVIKIKAKRIMIAERD